MKRLFDLSVVVALSPVWLPLFFMCYLAVKIKLGNPVFFYQIRSGMDDEPFEIIKFRTMLDKRDINGVALPDSERLTKFGKFLRSTSVDEIPELWNVLRGDMSLVGPRPLLMEYLPLYDEEQRRRHDVRPGITGWAQINGRNATSWDDRFKCDVWYIDNKSFWLDVKILFLTLIKVLTREGISANDHATMEKFNGNSST